MEEQNIHIDEIIVQYLTNDISDDGKKYLDSWVEESEANKSYFDQMQKVWNKSNGLEAFCCVDVKADFDLFKQRVGMSSKVIKLSVRRRFMRVAAVMIPTIMFLAAYGLYQSVPGFGKLQAFNTDGDIDKVVLADASEVTLNVNSKLVFEKDFSGKTRRLKLTGEGYFKVAKNPDKPFVVNVGGTEVEVLGTEFNLEENVNDQTVHLSVTEGRVLFTAGNEAVEVVAGESAVCLNNKITKGKLVSNNCLAWRTGQIVFEQASLDEVLKTIVDHFSELEIIENNTSDTSLKITTSFTNPSIEDVLVELRIHFKKKIEINDNKLIISD
ncbi:FecR family protein [Carboxylicivirga sp. M1479]|uniref:FecR family protein n=1 Tax=Carboxylicivirga sp. M1479 TaxID=2594476 RepID=UPI001177DB73|nr:FecR domain-containing protein [Carboxylicivirga sp. M1479]TRX62994.1 DUF4974 domain-containing protein [Carboxylicivirga sp. M1479]